jgi:hypothetical protein
MREHDASDKQKNIKTNELSVVWHVQTSGPMIEHLLSSDF